MNPGRYSVEVFYIYKAMPSGHGFLYVETSLIILDTIRLCSRYFDKQDLPSMETLRPHSSALAALGSLQRGACGFL